MKKYRVIAETVEQFEVIIDANSPEEAIEIAEQVDGGDFVRVEDMHNGSWDIVDATEV